MKYSFPIATWILALAFYVTTQPAISLVRILSKTFASSAVIVIAASIGIAGSALVWPRTKAWIAHRKAWGLIGFAFALAHATLAFSDPLSFSVAVALLRQNVRLGLIALTIFAILAITSNRWSQRFLGAGWKRLQRAGYVALFFVWSDLLILGDGTFARTPIGLVLLAVTTGALVVGVWGWFRPAKTEKNNEPGKPKT